MRRLFVVLLAGPALLLGMAGPASAAPVTTITHEKGLVDTFVGVINGCDEAGPLYRVTTTSNQVEKETLKDDGTFHGTNNFTGVFTDAKFYNSLLNTLYMAIAIPLGMIISLAIAMLLNRAVGGIGLYRAGYYMPAIVPLVAAFAAAVLVGAPRRT